MKVSDIGADERNVIPRFADPTVVEFSAGKGLDEFVKCIVANKSTKIVAAAGAGKSVRMPTELYKSLGGVLVHCVPSRLLAVSLHDYVLSLNHPGVPIHLCLEVMDEYPTSGIVYTYSAAFMGQVCRWNSADLNPGVFLYMDECHESDAGTAVIRRLRHALPGVHKYAESSATPGTGDVSSTFAQARLPSSVSEIKCSMTPPYEWRMTDNRVPWSLKKLSADILVFSDDDEEASIIMSKFIQSGLKASRLTGHTTPDEYRRVVASMDSSGQDVVSVLVLDYTFRSGFSFPTVDRIIDMSKVKFLVKEGGKTVAKYRNPYNAEVYQTKNRGGRVKNRNCDYFRMQFEPENVQVYLEGAEAMLACLWYRMLGYAPEPILSDTPGFSGTVPKNLLLAMAGKHVLTCYEFNTIWPGKPVLKVEAVDAPPINLESPLVQGDSPVFEDKVGGLSGVSKLNHDILKSPVVDVSTYSGIVGGRPPSVFSLKEDAEEDGILSEERFINAHRNSRAGLVPERSGVPPLPKVDGTFAAMKNISALKDSVKVPKLSLAVGEYYRLHGFEGETATGYFREGILGVVNSAHKQPLGRFVLSLPPDMALEARQRAVMDCNRATVKYRAVVSVLAGVEKQKDKFAILDADALHQWYEMVRDILVGTDSVIRQSFKVLETCGIGEVSSVRPSLFAQDEKGYVEAVLNILRACVAPSMTSIESAVGVNDSVDPNCMGELLEHAENYKHLGGRVNMRISGRSLRERFANMVLGGKPVEVDAIMDS